MDNPRKIKLFGDRQEALRKLGEGQSLLRMTKAISRLLGLPYYRLFSADKDVMAQSIRGMQDQIILSHTQEMGVEEEEENPSCTVTLSNVPAMIPPMKWYAPGQETFTKVGGAWVIRDPNGVVEIEGIDYIKTYYAVRVLDCSGCSSLDFTIGKEIGAIKSNSPYRPFWYRSERESGGLIYTYQGAMVPHYMGNPDSIPPILPNPMNHMIYSLWGSGQAEIIKADQDEGGTYILWRAYTEWSNVGPYVVDFSRTGLGYMLMQGFIRNEGNKLCESKPIIIKVDCCLKPAGDRQVILYWESLSGYEAGGPTCVDQPFMFYGSMKICQVPAIVNPLWAKLCTPRNTKYLYVIPDVKGGCLPFTWNLTAGGGWTLVPIKPFGEMAGLAYECTLGPPSCYESFDVTVTDRCGTVSTFHSKACCETGLTSLTIGYTSLLMGCGVSQTLTASGGCPPYSWSLSGGGAIIPSEDTFSVIYKSRAVNVNCDNPTITVSECCGDSESIKLAVNCNPYGAALRHTTLSFTGPVCNPWDYSGCADLCNATSHVMSASFNCDGSDWAPPCTAEQFASWCYCALKPGCTRECQPCTEGTILDYKEHASTVSGCGGWYDGIKFWNTLVDVRTSSMKAAGCCPLSPITGLPYD